MPTSDSDSKSSFPSWVKISLVGVVLLLTVAGAVHLLGRASYARWQRYAANLRATGEPLTLEEIEARRTGIPEELNSARLIELLGTELRDMNRTRFDVDGPVFIFDRADTGADFFAGVPRYRIDPSRAFLERHQDLLDSLAALEEMPTGRFDLALDESPFNMVMPALTFIRSAAKLEALCAIISLIDGDLEQAAASAKLEFHIGASLDEHPTVIGRLVQMPVNALAKETLESTLRVGELRGETLTDLMDVVDARLAAGTMKWAFLGERAFLIRVFDDVAAAKLTPGSIVGLAGTIGASSWLPEFIIRENQMRGVEMLTWLVEAADDPEAMTEAGQRIDTEVPALPPTQFFVRILVPSLSRAVVLHLRISAELQCARLALAAEQYRLSTGRLPESLGELVPDYVESVPTDPFDGQPMRLAATEKGIVIYSIDEDLVDDGGLVTRQPTRPYYRDRGFRLLRPEHRGLLLTDEPPPDDD